MSGTRQQILNIEPKNELYFEGPFTDIVTSRIKLSNPLDTAVCFKVKTTVPKRYCVRPSSGVLQAHESLMVAVMLQPFLYDPSEKTKHKFMIQSMVLPEFDGSLDNVWKDADPAKITDSKLICILRMAGELVVEPSHELVFEGPFVRPVHSTISLTNPSKQIICFKLLASSTRLSATPTTGVIQPDEKIEVSVVVQPFKYDPSEKTRDRIVIKSAVTENSDEATYCQLLDGTNTMDCMLKCVYTVPRLDDKIKPIKQGQSMTSAPQAPSLTQTEDPLEELALLRKEVALLREKDAQLRRTVLSGTCLTCGKGSGSTVGSTGVIDAIACVPPILYIILAIVVGVILGKFIG